MRPDSEDYSCYPEPPPQGLFTPAPSTMDMTMAPDAYVTFSRQSHDCFPAAAAATTMGFDGSVLSAEAPYMLSSDRPPPMYQDDDLRLPSSNLSTASVPSAPSSAMGSPRSNHGQPMPVAEWTAPQGLGVSPGIVGQHDYFATGTEYAPFGQQMDEFPPAHFEFAQPKPGFVGEFAQIPRSSQNGSISSSLSRDSCSTVVPDPMLAIETATSPASLSPTMSPASSRKSSMVFVSPTTSSSSFSSPPPAWSSPICGPAGLSPTAARPNPARLVSPFFSQSSGHFIAPLDSSCWFPLVASLSLSLSVLFSLSLSGPDDG